MKTFLIMGLLAGIVTAHPSQSQASPLTPVVAAVQPVDWYCGPRCRHYRAERWEQNHRWVQHRRWERERARRYYYNHYYRGW